MIRTYLCIKNKLVKNIPLKKLKQYIGKKNVTIWADLFQATPDEYKQIHGLFKFHPLTMEDVRKSIELPKVEVFDNYIFVVLHSIIQSQQDKYPKKREIDFFLGCNYLVSVHIHESLGVEHLAEKLEKNNSATSQKPDFMMYEIVDYFVDQYFPLLEIWDDKIEALEANIISQKNLHNTLKDIMYIKRELLYLKKSIAPQRDVINKLARRDFPLIHPRTSVYFRDVYDHIMRAYAELEIQRDILSGNFEAYTSVLSNRLALISNKMNEVMKRLTVIATIFMPLTFLAGVYGMNFHYFPEISWRYGYYIFWVLCVIIGLFMYWFFRRRKWA
ncbi:magnesium/cobalt transporter CorA [Candidatus Woesearchaeota archaeon]|nr:magnesium/cobalt transporter CorA [Candidatus Woesearchaeota archaeon]